MFCRKCGNQLQDDWVACPKCGENVLPCVVNETPAKPVKPESPPAFVQLIIGIAIVSVIGYMGGNLFYSSKPVSNIEAQAAQDAKYAQENKLTEANGLFILNHRSENGQTKGDIRNNTDRTYRYVEVRVQYYDDSGRLVASRISNTANLRPGEVWGFSVYQPEDATKYKMDGVKGRWQP